MSLKLGELALAVSHGWSPMKVALVVAVQPEKALSAGGDVVHSANTPRVAARDAPKGET